MGFSRAVRVGAQVLVGGTAPIAADGSTAFPGDLYAQTRCCLEIAEGALRQAGAARRDVVRTRVLLTDISRWQEAAQAHAEYFAEIRPVCTFMAVSAFVRADWLVEIELDCIVADFAV